MNKDTISQLVEQRSNSSSLDLSAIAPQLATEPLYLLKLNVKVGIQTLKLEGQHLGIEDRVMNLLQENAGGGYRAKLGAKLKNAASKLQARQKIIYNRYTVISEPFRLIHESSLPQALAEIEEMKQQADTLRQELLESYPEEYRMFLEWVESILKAANLDAQDISNALAAYAASYPTPDEIERKSLQILVEGPIKIPSLLEESKHRAQEAENRAKITQEQLEKQKLSLLARSQEQLEQTLIASLYDAKVRSQDEANSKLGELLVSYRTKGQDATSRTEQKWDTLTQRLEVLAQYDKTLLPLIDKAKLLQDIYLDPSPNLSLLAAELDDFRRLLKNRAKEQNNSGGLADLTKALALDEGYAELLGNLDEIASNPDPAKLRELKGKLASIEGLFKFRVKDLEKRWEAAQKAVNERLGVTDTSISPSPLQQHQGTDTPYDPIAGF